MSITTEDIKTQMYYQGEIPDDVKSALLKLGKSIKRSIAFVDWTADEIGDIVQKIKRDKEFAVYCVNSKKNRNEGMDSDNNFEVVIDTNIVKTSFLPSQYEKFADDWDVFYNPNITPLYDSKGQRIGDITKAWIRLYIDILIPDIYGRKLLLSFLTKQIVSVYPTLEDITQVSIRKMTEEFLRYTMNIQSRLKNNLRSKLADVQQEMQDHYRALQRLEKSFEENNTLYKSISRKISAFNTENNPEKLKEIFTNLVKGDKYKSIAYYNEYIVAYTGLIKIKHRDKTFEIGEFKITINLNGTVRMENMTKKYEDYDHPHISQSNPCLGNIKESLPKMIFNGDILNLLIILYEYLSTYNEEGPYIAIERGWGSEEDWCEDCDRPTHSCRCNNCPECGEDMDHCECDRCPRSGELMENTDCGSCDNYYDEEEGGDEPSCHY